MVIDCDATVTAIAAMHTHSLDGTHNMLNAMECARRDIDYRSKHDQFTTHSGRMREAKKIFAEQFVELHKSDLRLDLANQWTERYKVDLPPLPERGTLDLNAVLTSPYFAS
jgi:DNA-directed RNA polymerase